MKVKAIEPSARKELFEKLQPLIRASDENISDEWDGFHKYWDDLASQDDAVFEIAFEFWNIFDPQCPDNRYGVYKGYLHKIMIFLLSAAEYLPQPKRRRIEHPEIYDFWPFKSEEDRNLADAKNGEFVRSILAGLDYPEDPPPPLKDSLFMRIYFGIQERIIFFFEDAYDILTGKMWKKWRRKK